MTPTPEHLLIAVLLAAGLLCLLGHYDDLEP